MNRSSVSRWARPIGVLEPLVDDEVVWDASPSNPHAPGTKTWTHFGPAGRFVDPRSSLARDSSAAIMVPLPGTPTSSWRAIIFKT